MLGGRKKEKNVKLEKIQKKEYFFYSPSWGANWARILRDHRKSSSYIKNDHDNKKKVNRNNE